jgi:alkanesulfonate monooxygenase SsuD/methylene tetrahydromethanopterin reductase-like flavin-dependent oxidoreductase (luciferase family)
VWLLCATDDSEAAWTSRGSGERKTLRLVARYADGCNLFGDLERIRQLLGVLESHCERLGRDPT